MSTQAAISPGRAAWQRLRRNRSGITALIALGVLVLLCVLAPTPYSETTNDLANNLQAPSLAHWFGTDSLVAISSRECSMVAA